MLVQVHTMVIELRPSSEIWNGTNAVYGRAQLRASSGKKYI